MKEFLDYLKKAWGCGKWEIQGDQIVFHFGHLDLAYILRKYCDNCDDKESTTLFKGVFKFEDIPIEDFLLKYGGEFVYVYYPMAKNVKIPDIIEWEIMKGIEA